jgi:hypothetical protein
MRRSCRDPVPRLIENSMWIPEIRGWVEEIRLKRCLNSEGGVILLTFVSVCEYLVVYYESIKRDLTKYQTYI